MSGLELGVFMESQLPGLPADVAGTLVLGAALGENRALALISGRCTAAQAESLRRLREEKQYQRLNVTWDAFCAGYLRISRSQADKLIATLEEFGPEYFELSQLTRISPETYREIESSIRDGAITLCGDTIQLIPENAHRVAHAVAVLRAEKARSGPRPLDDRIEALLNHFATVFEWAIHNDVSWRQKLPAALAKMTDLLEGRRVLYPRYELRKP